MKTTLPASSEKQPSPPNKGSEALSWFSALKHSLQAARANLHFVVSEAKRIISSVNAINQLLSMSDESGRSSREKIVQ